MTDRAAAPLRSAAFAIFFYGTTTLFGLAGLPVRLVAPHLALPLAQAWVRTVLAGLRSLCGIRIVVTGLARLPADGPALIASQHQSAFDTLVWMVLLTRPSYVMKRELLRIPLFGPLLRPAGMIPVDRKAGAAALRGLLTDAARARDAGRQIIIFPEGTRTRPGDAVSLQSGVAAIAARLGLPVLPVATDSGLCWPRPWLGKRAGTIHIAIGAPIPPGVPRAEILAKIAETWHRCHADAFPPVENSVEQTPRGRVDGLVKPG